MIDMTLVDLSRLQFALTALYHFLFVPLTLGLSMILVIMEATYVMTGREIWRRMTKFWGVLFGINFAMGVATGITMEFQFGTNWAYYSHYVGDIFGAPLAIEGPDGVLPRVDVRRALLLRLGPALEGRAPRRDGARRARLESVGALDLDRERVDAASGRRRLQLRDDANGAHVVLGRAVQRRRAIEVRAHRCGRLCHGRRVRARDIRLVFAARPQPRSRAALDGRGRELRARLGAVGRRARRRVGLHGDREPGDEDRRHRGDVEDRARARRLRDIRHPGSRRARDPRRAQDPVGARPDRDALARPRGSGHRGSARRGAHPDRERHHRARGAAAAAPQSGRRGREDAVRRAQGGFGLRPLVAEANGQSRGRRRRRRSRSPRCRRFRTCRCCSGRSA